MRNDLASVHVDVPNIEPSQLSTVGPQIQTEKSARLVIHNMLWNMLSLPPRITVLDEPTFSRAHFAATLQRPGFRVEGCGFHPPNFDDVVVCYIQNPLLELLLPCGRGSSVPRPRGHDVSSDQLSSMQARDWNTKGLVFPVFPLRETYWKKPSIAFGWDRNFQCFRWAQRESTGIWPKSRASCLVSRPSCRLGCCVTVQNLLNIEPVGYPIHRSRSNMVLTG